jgi:outer membrane protein OmpA-like peptidoglycan-associated protein
MRTVFLAGTALALFGIPAFAGPAATAPAKLIILAQAETEDPAVLAAQEAVEAARAALADATANDGDVRAARRALNQALKDLNEARVAAGLPPLGRDGDTAGKRQPPQTNEPPAQTVDTPPATDEPPAETVETPPATDEPPAETVETPPATDDPPATIVETPPAQEEAPAAIVETPPADQPAVTDTDTETQKPFRKGKRQPAQVETPSEEAPAAVTETPTDDTQASPFRKKRPRLGEGGEPGKPTPPPQFGEEGKPPVKTGADVKEGQEVEASDGRVVTKEGGKLIIKSDDDVRFQREGKVKTEPTKDGGSITTVTRRNGVQVVTVRDRDGNIVQRFRKMRDGQVEILIGAVEGPGGPPGMEGPKFPKRPKFRPGKGVPPIGAGGDFNFEVYLPPVQIQIPEEDYVVESRRASRRQIEEALEAEPVERIERPYSLEEIRRSERLRQKVRRIDIDTITFEFGSAEVGDDQIPSLQSIGETLQRIISRDPNEVYLIEGHTDAVGSDLANLALSDRRAESVAEILTYYFEIPPENLITQGYGEAYLKVQTLAPERQNRRVTMRRITPLLGNDQYSQQQ